MKTQKQLPKEFTFFCDENSIEQLEKLGVDLDYYEITEKDYGDFYEVENKKITSSGYYYELKRTKFQIISLADYIDQEEPIQSEQKWQSKTRGGYEFIILEKFNNQLFGGVQSNGRWYGATWGLNGDFNCISFEDSWDLLPFDPNAQRKEELQAQINKLQEELNSLEK